MSKLLQIAGCEVIEIVGQWQAYTKSQTSYFRAGNVVNNAGQQSSSSFSHPSTSTKDVFMYGGIYYGTA